MDAQRSLSPLLLLSLLLLPLLLLPLLLLQFCLCCGRYLRVSILVFAAFVAAATALVSAAPCMWHLFPLLPLLLLLQIADSCLLPPSGARQAMYSLALAGFARFHESVRVAVNVAS